MRLISLETSKKRLIRIVCNLVSVLITLEISSQLLYPGTTEIVVREPSVGRRLQKNIDLELWNGESKRLVRIRSNSYGFRGDEPESPKPDDVRRIAVLGDSFVNAIQVEECDTMCCLLEEHLNERQNETRSAGKRWEVLNFGISGSATADQYLRYLQTLRELEPDVILVCFSMETDPADNHPHLSSLPMVHFDLDQQGELVLLPESSLNASAANFLNRHSRLYQWQKKHLNRFASRFKPQKKSIGPRDQIYLTPIPDEFEYSWILTERILQTFRDVVVADGVEFLVASIPSGREIYDEQFQALIEEGQQSGLAVEFDRDQPIRRLTDICTTNQISLIALEDSFRKYADEHSAEEELLFYNGKGHMTVVGNRVAGQVLAEQLHLRFSAPSQYRTAPGTKVRIAEGSGRSRISVR